MPKPSSFHPMCVYIYIKTFSWIKDRDAIRRNFQKNLRITDNITDWNDIIYRKRLRVERSRRRFFENTDELIDRRRKELLTKVKKRLINRSQIFVRNLLSLYYLRFVICIYYFFLDSSVPLNSSNEEFSFFLEKKYPLDRNSLERTEEEEEEVFFQKDGA